MQPSTCNQIIFWKENFHTRKFRKNSELQVRIKLITLQVLARQKVTNLASNLWTLAAKENIRSPEYDETKLIYHLVNNAGQQPPSLIIFGVVFGHSQGSSNSVQFSLFPSIFHSVFAEVNHFTFIAFVCNCFLAIFRSHPTGCVLVSICETVHSWGYHCASAWWVLLIGLSWLPSALAFGSLSLSRCLPHTHLLAMGLNNKLIERRIVMSCYRGSKIPRSQQSFWQGRPLALSKDRRKTWATILFLSAIMHSKVIHVKFIFFFSNNWEWLTASNFLQPIRLTVG